MTELAKVLTSVILAWSGLCLMFSGVGLLVRRLYGLRTQDAENCLTAFWIGWASVIFFLQLWHLQFPVDWRAFALVSTAGIAGLLWNHEDLFVLHRNARTKWAFWLALLFVAILLADCAILSPKVYDSGLYHLSSVRWARSYPVVPGLGNLHGRLAFNNSYFLYVAMLEAGHWSHASHHLANGLLLLVLFAQILLSSFQMLWNKGPQPACRVFTMLLLAPVLSEALRPDRSLSSPTPDLAVFILGIILSRQMLALLSNHRCGHDESGYLVITVIALAVAGITSKVSFVVLGGTAAVLSVAVWVGRSVGRDRSYPRKTLTWAIAYTALGLLPWMGRGIILSGYVAYPSPFGAVPVEWRIPHELVVNMADWIRAGACNLDGPSSRMMEHWRWVAPWARGMLGARFDVIVPLALTASAGLFGLCFRLRARKQKSEVALCAENEKRGLEWMVLVPTAASLVFWFATAPSIRFAGAVFWVMAAVAMTIVYGPLTQCFGIRRMPVFAACLTISLSIIPLRYMSWTGPGENKGFHATPRAELKKFVTDFGLILYVPKKGDQCWDAPLPCTPYPNARLRLRREGEVRYGFVIESAEQAYR